jgi:hypothetical protein
MVRLRYKQSLRVQRGIFLPATVRLGRVRLLLLAALATQLYLLLQALGAYLRALQNAGLLLLVQAVDKMVVRRATERVEAQALGGLLSPF